jgi:hypothetical protein
MVVAIVGDEMDFGSTFNSLSADQKPYFLNF